DAMTSQPLQLPLSDPPAPDADPATVAAAFSASEQKLSEFSFKQFSNFRPALAEPEADIGRLLAHLSRPDLPTGLAVLCLRCLRLLCRHRPNLEACDPARFLEAGLACLLDRSGLADLADGGKAEPQQRPVEEVTESLMCLCNLGIQLDGLVQRLVDLRCPAALLRRAAGLTAESLELDWPAFDLRLLFLLAAKCPAARQDLRLHRRGVAQLTQLLQLASEPPLLSDKRCDLLGDLVKVLYTLAAGTAGPGDKDDSLAEGEETAFHQLAGLLRRLLLADCTSPDRRDRLTQHCVSLLLCLPRDSFDRLLSEDVPAAASSAASTASNFEGKGVEAIDVVLNLLDTRLALFSASCTADPAAVAAVLPAGVSLTGGALENLVPVLSALFEACRSSRTIRRYCKHRLLPRRSSDQMAQLPEEGASMRSRLCRTLTHPCTQAADMAASLVHALCKASIAKAVRHTGYGNFAGFLARRGLLAAGPSAGDSTVYSSDSSGDGEDEDEDDGAGAADQQGGAADGDKANGAASWSYNPVTGRREPPRPDPTAGMTEEQKEFEVHRIMQAIDRLQATGVISPAVIGEDGRPCPVSHPLELMDRLAEQSGGKRREGGGGEESSDSDG
ncbi:hypothetical protein BOX15_Mlig018804g2, partial [Macrostomum lignano]